VCDPKDRSGRESRGMCLTGPEHQQTDERSGAEKRACSAKAAAPLAPGALCASARTPRHKAFSWEGRGPFSAEGPCPGSCGGRIQAAHSVFLLRWNPFTREDVHALSICVCWPASSAAQLGNQLEGNIVQGRLQSKKLRQELCFQEKIPKQSSHVLYFSITLDTLGNNRRDRRKTSRYFCHTFPVLV